MYHLGILAVDMGVGKTVQLMALIFQNRPTGIDRTTLLVVPAGAIEMWKVNLAKFKEIKYIEYNGYRKDFLGIEELSEYEVILSTYTHVSRQYNTYASRTCDTRMIANQSRKESLLLASTHHNTEVRSQGLGGLPLRHTDHNSQLKRRTKYSPSNLPTRETQPSGIWRASVPVPGSSSQRRSSFQNDNLESKNREGSGQQMRIEDNHDSMASKLNVEAHLQKGGGEGKKAKERDHQGDTTFTQQGTSARKPGSE